MFNTSRVFEFSNSDFQTSLSRFIEFVANMNGCAVSFVPYYQTGSG